MIDNVEIEEYEEFAKLVADNVDGVYSEEDMQEAYLRGYDLGKGIEQLSDFQKRVARKNFERWMDREFK